MEEEQLIGKLREKGFKVTPQRLAICKFVLSSKKHPTVEEVFAAMQKKHPTMSLATVYQTLHLLTKIGLLQEMGPSIGSSRYDPNNSPHINIVCKNCGKIEDYESGSITEFWSQITGELKCKIVGQNLMISTYCDKCKKSLD